MDEVQIAEIIQRRLTNALSILTPLTVIASPKGVAVSYFTGLLRRPAKAGLLAMTTYLISLY